MKRISWLDVLIVILFLLTVYLILTRIFGHSATDFTILVSMFGFFGSFVLKLMQAVYSLNRETGEIRIRTANGFEMVKNDINNLRENNDLILNDLGKIKKKLKI